MTDFAPPAAADGGIVYVLTNPAMPTLVKIGRTSGEGVDQRVAELSRATGVPLPFQVVVARRVHDAFAVERALHVAFGPDRVNPKREFFEIEPHRAKAIIDAFPGQDVTPQAEAAAEREIEQDEPGATQAARRFISRRPPLNYIEMGLPVGTVLTHAGTGEQAVVAEPRKVEFRGEIMSLTRAHRLLNEAAYDVQPGNFWLAGERSLNEIYDETYPRRVHGDD